MDFGTDANKLWDKDYEEMIIDTLSARVNKISPTNKKIKRSYKLVSLGGEIKVGRKSDGRIMATKEEVAAIFNHIHNAWGHKNSKITHRRISEQYANITLSIVQTLMKECFLCKDNKLTPISKKTPKLRRTAETSPSEIPAPNETVIDNDLVMSPINLEILKHRGKVSLLDFQNIQDGNFKFILYYREEVTKFNLLRALASNSVKEIARELLNIFLEFNPPHILESEQGREFTEDIIGEMALLWPNLLLINGRYHESNDYEHCNSHVIKLLINWMESHNCNTWSVGLRVVQWKLNSLYDEELKTIPYRAMFGQNKKMGINSLVPKEYMTRIKCGMLEEDLEDLFKSEKKQLVAVDMKKCTYFVNGTKDVQ